jgi:branched-chain amino acid transport system permease protein
VRRARTRDALEVDSILATFGMMFIVQGIMLAMFGGAYFSYSFLAIPVSLFGEILALNRLIAFGLAVMVGLALYLVLTRTRYGTAIRAVAVDWPRNWSRSTSSRPRHLRSRSAAPWWRRPAFSSACS